MLSTAAVLAKVAVVTPSIAVVKVVVVARPVAVAKVAIVMRPITVAKVTVVARPVAVVVASGRRQDAQTADYRGKRKRHHDLATS